MNHDTEAEVEDAEAAVEEDAEVVAVVAVVAA